MPATHETIYEGIVEGQISAVPESVKQALADGYEAESILKETLIPAMTEVGRLYEAGEYFVPEMLMAAKAMKAGMEILKPRLVDAAVEPAGRVIIGTVQGDLHDIGKNLVSMMLEGAGFDVEDMGVDVPAEEFVAAVLQKKPDILALSALLTTTLPQQKAVVDAVSEAGVRDSVKIIIGGAPVTQGFTDEIGADGFAPDAGSAAELAKGLVGQNS
jgi:5-methyltetrahydrofolate--homocysteine methyltransferase